MLSISPALNSLWRFKQNKPETTVIPLLRNFLKYLMLLPTNLKQNHFFLSSSFSWPECQSKLQNESLSYYIAKILFKRIFTAYAKLHFIL